MNIGITLGIPFANVKKKILALNLDGVDDNIQLPSMTMDSIELDYISVSGSILLDARVGMANGYVARTGVLNGSWTQLLVNGSVSASIPQNVRTKVKVVASASFTDDVTLFSNYVNGGFMKGTLFGVTCYLNNQVVAKYDMSKRNLQDQSGNGKHATLTGGTWIEV